MLTDRQLAIHFAGVLAATLDYFGHMTWCEGHRQDIPCNYEPCRQAREAVALAISLGLLPVPEAEVEATRQALRQALDAELPVEAV